MAAPSNQNYTVFNTQNVNDLREILENFNDSLLDSRLYHVGVDLAARVYQVCYFDENGQDQNICYSKEQFTHFLENPPRKPLFIAMEGCSGCNYWADVIESYGHIPVIINAKFIKNMKRRGSNKDDKNDALTIRKALRCGEDLPLSLRHSQTDMGIKAVFSSYEQTIKDVTKICNITRGYLIDIGEYGELDSCTTGENAIKCIRAFIEGHIHDPHFKDHIAYLQINLKKLQQSLELLDQYTQELEKHADRNEMCKLIQTVPGMGKLIALLMAVIIKDISRFKSARALQAFFGIVTAHTGSGNKIVPGRMSIKGDPLFKKWIYQAVLAIAHKGRYKNLKPRSQWLIDTFDESSTAFKLKVIKAAAKIIRNVYGVLKSGKGYDPEINDSLGSNKARTNRHPNNSKSSYNQDGINQFNHDVNKKKLPSFDNATELQKLGATA